MSMYYSHLLVPPDRSLAFDAECMTAFLEAVVHAGFVGRNAERFVQMRPVPEGAFYWGMSRDMPKMGRYRGPNPASWIRPDSEAELLAALRDAPNVGATVWSELRPNRVPLLQLEAMQSDGTTVNRIDMDDPQFDEVFYVAVTCWRMEVPVSMSDDGHREETASVPFGEPIEADAKWPPAAVANYPNKPGSIEVPGIGAARSWVSVTFGKYVFPPDCLFEERFSKEHGLVLAAPELLALAQRLLGSELRQTCAWG